MPSQSGALNALELNSIKALPGLSNTRSTRETGIPGCQRGQTHAENTMTTRRTGKDLTLK